MTILSGGASIGLFFDIYRMIRWKFRLNKTLTFLGDICFSLLSALILFSFAQKANYLELRFYLFGGALLGLLLYLRLFSKPVKKLLGGLFQLLSRIKKLIVAALGTLFQSIASFLKALMRLPYGSLEWLALLFYRMIEALGREGIRQVRRVLPMKPKQPKD